MHYMLYVSTIGSGVLPLPCNNEISQAMVISLLDVSITVFTVS